MAIVELVLVAVRAALGWRRSLRGNNLGTVWEQYALRPFRRIVFRSWTYWLCKLL